MHSDSTAEGGGTGAGDATGATGEAVLIVSFGGPEGPADVRPFLENVTRGRAVPADRLDEVEGHYRSFGGRSPINDQVRALIAALRAELDRSGRTDLPIYWGNRNWHPYLADTMAEMAADGVRTATAFVTSAFSSYSGCRQYLEDIDRARELVGSNAPRVDKLRVYFDHPGFIEPLAERTRSALAVVAAMGPQGPGDVAATGVTEPVQLLFCAHSIPQSLAATCAYQAQLQAAAQLVVDRLDAERPGLALRWELVWQSRSGPPQVPWLEPDVSDRLEELAALGVRRVVLVPLGFISDHLEVVYDLDTVALAKAAQLGLHAVRADTVGVDPRFVSMIADLIDERRQAERGGAPPRPALSTLGVWPDHCAAGCCPPPAARPAQRPTP